MAGYSTQDTSNTSATHLGDVSASNWGYSLINARHLQFHFKVN